MAERDPESHLTTITSTDLLNGLRSPDNQTVWQQYVDRYRPVIVAYAHRIGLPAADAEDAAQQTLSAFYVAYRDGKYERDKGRLHNWLFGIARNQIRNWRRTRRNREVQVAAQDGETDFFDQLGDEDQWEQIWDQEWRGAVMRQCLAEVRREVGEKTFTAFELFASKGWPARKVAEHLGLTSNAVFIAKHRVLQRVRGLLPQIETIW